MKKIVNDLAEGSFQSGAWNKRNDMWRVDCQQKNVIQTTVPPHLQFQ